MANLVHLVRHGETHNPNDVVYASLPGFDLSERGRSQTRDTARFLGSQSIVAIWSSPLQRALRTAEIVAERTGHSVDIDDDLTEWALLDRWAGVPWDEVDDRHVGELTAYLEDPTDLAFSNETLGELADRITGVIDRLDEQYPHGEVVVVTHQDPLQAARLQLTGRPLKELATDKPGHGSVISLRPGSPWVEYSVWSPGQHV
ncbi:MAG: histidine phosphatase family protein [Acidimicrobiia bacterium]|nr:histidine phosphatase family protein [Acidimicrobiia bacterium]